jgi:hypothetical protein
VQGLVGKQGIEYLRIVTSRNNVLEGGTDINQARCKNFELDIRKDCKPISFCGAVETRKSIIFYKKLLYKIIFDVKRNKFNKNI